ncbi:MAG: acetate--CoA ligase family protein [Thermoplasmatota archaeon]
MNSNGPDIGRLFEPDGVAVIGASRDRSKIGHTIVDNILASGYRGNLYPINPKGGDLNGIEIRTSLFDPGVGNVDVAVISIPSKFVFDAVKDCGKKGVKFLVIITSGFSEVGNSEEEVKLVKYARDHGMRVLGPNIFGIYSANADMNATFGSKNVLKGNVGIITQSGALGIAMIGKTAIEGIGLSAMISLGNKSDLDESDLMEYLLKDDNTRIIMCYIEGVQNGERFLQTLKRITKRKPVIVIKSGRSRRGALAAASHTGSLAGSDKVFDKVMRQAGVIRADTLDEAFNWCKFLSQAPLPRGENVVIVTNGGGIGVLATDACEKYDLKLLDDLKLMEETYGDATPEFGSVKNPVDITGGARAGDYDKALRAGLDKDRIDAVLSLYCETSTLNVENLVKMIEENHHRYILKGKPIVFSLVGGEKVASAIDTLTEKGIPIYGDVDEAVQVLGALYRFYRFRSEPTEPYAEFEMDTGRIEDIIGRVREDGRTFLLADEARELMDVAGVRMPRSMVARNLDEAVRFSNEIGHPVVMKVVSRDIIHKSDAGGVALDLENEEEVIDAYQAIMTSCRAHDPGARIGGVEVCEMVTRGVETIIGARQDNNFGPVIMFGMGGIYVEVLKDVSFRSVPINRTEITRMIKETRAYPLLLGVRGEEKKDIDAVVDTIIRMGSLIDKNREISDIEINPLIAYDQGKGVKALDVRVLLSKEKGV